MSDSGTSSLFDFENNLFRNIFDAVTIAIAIIGLDGSLLDVNRSFCQLFGDSKEKLLTKSYGDILGGDLENDLSYFEKLRTNKIQIYQTEKSLFNKQGDELWFALSASLVRDDSQKPLYFILQIQDITARKSAELSLSKSEEKYRALVKAMAQIEWKANTKGFTTFTTNAWSELTGQEPEDLHGLNWMKYIHPHDRKKTILEWRKVIKNKSICNFEHRIRMRDGSYRDFLVRGVPIFDENREIIEWIGVSADITEMRKTERKLREIEERLQLALRGNNDGVYDLNLHTNDFYFTSRNREMLGFNEEEMGNNLEDFAAMVHPEDFQMAKQKLVEHLKNIKPFLSIEMRLRTKEGGYKWIHSRGQAVRDEKGRAVRLVGSHTDISKRKEAEEALKTANEELRKALEEVKILRGMLPICCYCKHIRDDKSYWRTVEEYISEHTEAQFSHSICPECYEMHVTPQIAELKKRRNES